MRLKIILIGILCFSSPGLFARDRLHMVGSNTLYPFIARLSESFSEKEHQKTPIIESMGTGSGAKLFCEGFGLRTPDILNASRPLTETEKQKCKSNNVEWHEVKLGYDGLVFAQAKRPQKMTLTKEHLYKGLSQMLFKGGMFTLNLNKNWNEIDPFLPERPILFFGPQSGSGTKDALIDMILVSYCKQSEHFHNLTSRQKKTFCYNIRNDLHYVEIGENYHFIFHKTLQNANAIGIFGYGFFLSFQDKLDPILINGYLPSPQNFENQTYPLIRPLYLYVKKNHLHEQGLSLFLKFIMKSPALKQEGSLSKLGFIPLHKTEYTLEQQIQKIVH